MIPQWKTHSSFVNVRTQSISDIPQRLTKESALPTAKYLVIVRRTIGGQNKKIIYILDVLYLKLIFIRMWLF